MYLPELNNHFNGLKQDEDEGEAEEQFQALVFTLAKTVESVTGHWDHDNSDNVLNPKRDDGERSGRPFPVWPCPRHEEMPESFDDEHPNTGLQSTGEGNAAAAAAAVVRGLTL